MARRITPVERNEADAARDRAAALIAAQNHVLELAVSDATLTDTLEAIVAIVENLSSSGALASILMLDTDGKHLCHGAGQSLPDAYNQAIDGIAIGAAVGSCGTAAHRNEPVFVCDIGTDSLWSDFRELALGRGRHRVGSRSPPDKAALPGVAVFRLRRERWDRSRHAPPDQAVPQRRTRRSLG